jgi:hypothetical protein
MLDGRHRSRFANETRAEIGAARFAADDLDRHLPPERRILREIDAAHAALPDRAKNAVAGDLRPFAAGRRHRDRRVTGRTNAGARVQRLRAARTLSSR